MATHDIELSVIIPTYNRAGQLGRLVRGLREQRLASDLFEVIFVNDGSTDNTAEVLQHVVENAAVLGPAHCRVINQENTGQTLARQAGVDVSRGRILVFLDDDMALCSADFLLAHLSAHQSGDPRVVYGQIVAPDNPALRPAFERYQDFHFRRLYHRFETGAVKPAGCHLFTGNVSITKSLFVEVGGFDPAFKYCEDTELGIRIEAQSEAQFGYAKQAKSVHHSEPGSYQSFRDQATMYGAYYYKIAQLHADQTGFNPYRDLVSPQISKAVFVRLAIMSSSLSTWVCSGLVRTAQVLNRVGGEKLAIKLCAAIYISHFTMGLKRCLADRRRLQTHLQAVKVAVTGQ